MAESKKTDYTFSFLSETTNSNTTAQPSKELAIVQKSSAQMTNLLQDLLKNYGKDIAKAAYDAALKGAKDATNTSNPDVNILKDKAIDLLIKKIDILISKDKAAPGKSNTSGETTTSKPMLTVENAKKLFDMYTKGSTDPLDQGKLENVLIRVIKETLSKADKDSKAKDIETNINKVLKSSQEVIGALGKAKGLVQSDNKLDLLSEGRQFANLFQEMSKALNEMRTASTELKQTVSTLPEATKKALEGLGANATSLIAGTRGRISTFKENEALDPSLLLKNALTSLVAEIKRTNPDLASKTVIQSIEKFKGNPDDFAKLIDGMKPVKDSIDKLSDTNIKSLQGISKLVTQFGEIFNNIPDMPTGMIDSDRWRDFAKGMNTVKKATAELVTKLNVNSKELDDYLAKTHTTTVDIKLGKNELTPVVVDIESAIKQLVTELTKLSDMEVKQGSSTPGSPAHQKFKSKQLLEVLDTTKDSMAAIKKMAQDELKGNDPKTAAFYDKVPEVRKSMQTIKDLTQPYDAKEVQQAKNKFVEGLKDFTEEIVDTAKKASTDLADTTSSITENMYQGIKDLTKFGIKKQDKVYSYPEMTLAATRQTDMEFPDKIKNAEESHAIVKENLHTLTNSLVDLQKYIIKSLESGFKKSDSGWAIVRKSADESIDNYFKITEGFNKKTAGKQYSLKIADIKGLQKATKSSTADPIALIESFKEQVNKDLLSKNEGNLAEAVGNWIKRFSKDDIINWKGINDSLAKELGNLKSAESTVGNAPSESLINKLKALPKNDLRDLYKATVGEVVAEKKLTVPQGKSISPYVRDVAIPAAKLTPSGANIFETQQGSQRVIPKFATYKTGFENLYERLAETKNFNVKKEYHKKVKELGIRPSASDFDEANALSTSMITDLGQSSPEARRFLADQYKSASVIRGQKLTDQKQIKDPTEFTNKISKVLEEQFSGDFNVTDLIKAMEDNKLAAYDLTRSMESVEFKDIYKMFQDLLSKSGAVESLATNPRFDSNIRDQETMLNKLVGKIPIADPTRPRRYAHQEKIVNLMSMTNPAIHKRGTAGFSPEDQKQYIRDLNLNLRDFVKETNLLNSAGVGDRKLPLDIKTLSSLGVPESQAANLDEFRLANHDPDTKHLAPFKATNLKMYSDVLPEFAPFAQFQQLGRNISNVTNAMAYRPSGAQIGTDYPGLRSEKGDAIISGGRHGDQGYGFNVIAELRNTASTFEDQIVISGKLADVLTSVTKNLIKPDELGKLNLVTDTGDIRNPADLAVGNIKPKTLIDSQKGIESVDRLIQTVLGIKDEYKGRPDDALIKEVHKAVTVVRGQELNVQVAKIVETFMNYYGRKFTTQYGSKGVAITAGGGHEMTGDEVAAMFKDKKIEVIPTDERGKAGLGSAIMPKSMGDLLAELIEANVKDLKIKGTVADSMSKKLRASGNKFMLDMFTDVGVGVVPAEEAKIQKKLYQDVAYIINRIGLELKQGAEGIKELKEFYKYSDEVSGELYEEKPIDIRISSFGAAKRGLQTENLETIMNNVIGAGTKGKTVIKDSFEADTYKKLLGGGKGSLAYYSEALGYEKQTPSAAGLEADMTKLLKTKRDDEGSPEFKKQLKELMALESSSYYSNIIDEFGDARKSIVGPKFVEVLEDPHSNPAWSEKDIEKQIKGERLNLPAFGAYASIFGEQSAFIQQMSAAIPLESKKHWEFVKALQVLNDSRTDMAQKLLSSAKRIDVSKLRSFDASTGTFDEKELSTSLAGTVLDTETYPEALNLQIPDTQDPTKRTSFYVPNALTRTTYPEPTMAGEYGMDNVSRRLQNVVNFAKDVDDQLIKIRKSGSTLTYNTIGRIKDNLKQDRANVAKIVGTDPQNKQLSAKEETTLKNILGNMTSVLAKYDVDSRLSYGQTGDAKGAFGSRKDYIESFLENQFSRNSRAKAYQTTISQAVDQIIGPMGKEEDEPNPFYKQRYAQDASIIGPIEKNQKALEGLSKSLGIKPPTEEDALGGSLKKLERAKIEYYNAVANSVLGKTGSVQELIFSRKIPAVMAKAIQATVDKTEDFKNFSNALSAISAQADELGVPDLSALEDVASATDVLYKDHAAKVAKYKKKGLPVLKQHELGIPEAQAEKLPAEFIKKYDVAESGKLTPILDKEDYVKGKNLKELLQYRQALEAGKTQFAEGSSDRMSIEHDLQNRLTPYVESVRYPFTGISSVQPFEAKLLSPKPGERQLEKHTLMAPGIPEMDFDAFKQIKKQAELALYGEVDDTGKRTKLGLMGALEAEQSKSMPDPVRVEKLNKAMDALDKAISDVIPKYVAQQQKLDFDGDQIEIHSAKTVAARKEIEQHFKSLTDPSAFKGTTAQVFRDQFTYDAMVPSTGKYTLAEQQLAFQKKFAPEEGFGFLKNPFLTEKLEYLSDPERIDILSKVPGEGGVPMGPVNAISSVLPNLFREEDQRNSIMNALRSVEEPTEEGQVATDAYINELIGALQNLGGNIHEIVTEGIKAELFDTKYLTTVNAQLFKTNTGPDTEALNRLLKLFERNVGFGSGTIRNQGSYDFSPEVAKRLPTDLNVLGSTMGEELTTMMNEVIRVGIQKGLDVKHAGEIPIATEMANLIASGPIGVEKLIGKIRNEEGSYKDLNEFSQANKKALDRNFAVTSTEDLRADAVKLAKGRGENLHKFSSKNRDELKKYISEHIGFEGFLRELSTQVVEAAYKGIEEDAKRAKDPTKVPKASDIENILAAGQPLNIREIAEKPLLPLYKYRTSSASGYKQRQIHDEKYPEIVTPELEKLFNPKNKYDKSILEKYKNAKAISINLQDDILEFTNSTEDQRGSYAMMLQSTIDNLKADQEKITELNMLMEAEGDRTSFSVADRLSGAAPMSSFTAEILSIKKSKDRFERLEEVSKQVGSPSFGQKQKQRLLPTFIEDAGVYADANIMSKLKPEDEYGSQREYAEDYYKQEEALKDEYLSKAYAVAQSDTILKVAKSKKNEGEFLKSFIPNTPMSSERYDEIRERMRQESDDRMFASTNRSGMNADQFGQNLQDSGGRGGANVLNRGAGTGGVVDVRVVALANGVGVFLGEGRTMAETTTYRNPQRKISDDLERDLEKAYAISNMISGGLNQAKDSNFGLKYRASGLKGVGSNSEEDLKKQIDNIAKSMQGIGEKKDIMESSSLLGNAIHAKLEDIYKGQTKYYTTSEPTLGGSPPETEKYITETEVPISPKFVDPVGGEISGTMDVVRKRQDGTIDEIIDVKTISKHNFEALQEALRSLGKDEASIEEVKGALGPGYLRDTKLDEVLSQLNLYLKASNESAKASAHFYSNTDTDYFKPVKLSASFSQERFGRDMNAVAAARNVVTRSGGTFAPTASYEKAQEIAKQTSSQEVPSEAIEELHRIATEYYKAVTSKTDKRRYYDLQSNERTYDKDEFENLNKRRQDSATKFKTLDEMLKAHPIAEGSEASVIAEHLKTMQRDAKSFQRDTQGLDLEGPDFERFPKQIQEFVQETIKKGPRGMDYSELVTASNKPIKKDATLQEQAARLEDKDISRAWKAYRIALGEYYVNMINEAEKEIDAAEPNSEAQYNAFDKYQARVNKFQKRIKSDLGKSTDIYTTDHRYISPDSAKGAGVFLERPELIKKANQPLGEDDRLKNAFNKLTDLDREVLPIPREAVREALSSITQMDQAIVQLYTDGDKIAIMGDKIEEAFNFTTLRRSISRLKEALSTQLSFNVKDVYDPEQIAYLQEVLKQVKQIERTYINLDLEGQSFNKANSAYKFPTLIDVPRSFNRDEQGAVNTLNEHSLRQYFQRPESEGGARKGDVIPYNRKVFGPNGRVITNQQVVFQKLGDTFNSSGEKVGVFKERFKDLNKIIGDGNRTFSIAIERVIKWGAAASVVYGGMAYLKEAVNHISEVETAMARLQMVMNPISTNFTALRKSAVGFAKQYGVETTDVLQSMRVFAQQGLGQDEVVERTQTSTLAANVTTLNATDATEALTASMKVFRMEGENSMRFLDAWSEVEAKAAITAGDLADAIKKAASAGKNAGFTFDELNGMIAAIGSVTRQTGKEVGTSLRFIFRRLTSEKGPKELAKLNIPIVGDSGQLRPGFDVLSDLSERWKTLGNAQKLSIAQAIGGTRQYNSVLVLMDNWEEVMRSLTNSINSKGSAERRNLELMKTYSKQLEQTKASASELKIEVGKLVLPTFKAGLSGMRTFLEVVNAIPAPIKLAAAGLTTFFAFAAKGAPIMEGIAASMSKGKLLFKDLGEDFKKGIKVGGYETLGIGDPTTSNVLEGMTTIGDPQASGLDRFHSALGKTGYLITDISKKYNKFLGDSVKTPADMAAKVSGTLKDTLQGLDDGIDWAQKGLLLNNAGGPATWIDDIGAQIAEAGIKGTKWTAALSEKGSKFLGAGAGKFIDQFAAENTGLVKAITPLAVTGIGVGAAAGPIFKQIKEYLATADQYRDEKYKSIAADEKEIQSLRSVQDEYDKYGNKLKSISEFAASPGDQAKALDLDTYQSPLLEIIRLQEKLRGFNNNLLDVSPNAVAGYDEFGNAIAGVTTNLRSYLDVLERSRGKELAQKRVDVAGRYIKDVTATGGSEKVKEELKSLAEEFPLIGELLASNISVSTKQAISTVSKELNKLISAKNQSPVATAFDKDIEKLEQKLSELRSTFKSSVREINKTLDDIDLKGLTSQDIVEIFNAPELQKGYELLLEYDVKFNTNFTKGKADVGDLVGQRVLSGLNPQIGGILEALPELTVENAKEQRIKPITAQTDADKATARTGDLAILSEEFAKRYSIAGRQALLTVKDTDELALEYFNKRLNKVVSIDVGTQDVSPFVQAIIPVQRIMMETEDQLAQLNAFVVGAEAGLTAMSPQTLRERNLDLGSRFYSDITTSSLVQSDKTYDPIADTFGTSESRANYAKDFKKYLSDPMTEYSNKLDQLRTLTYEGLESSDINLVGALRDELSGMQDVLKNNQVVFQYRAVHEDLNKTLEAGTRTLKQNLAVEKERLQTNTYNSGYLKGVSKDLESIELGSYAPTELSSQQRLLKESPKFKGISTDVRLLDVAITALNEQIEAIAKASVDIETIDKLNTGFGNVITGAEREDFVKLTKAGADPIEAKMVLQNDAMLKEERIINSNLEEIIGLINPEETAAKLGKRISEDIAGSSKKLLPVSIFRDLGSLSRLREKAVDRGDYETAGRMDQLLNSLSAQTVSTLGVSKSLRSLGFSDASNKLNPFANAISKEEFIGRAIGGANVSPDQFVNNLDRAKNGVFSSESIKDTGAFKNWKDISESSSKESLISSKNIVKASAALALATQYSKLTEGSKTAELANRIETIQEDITSNTNAGIPVDDLTKELIATRMAYDKSNKMSTIYGVTQASSGIVGGGALLGKTLGLSEGGAKGMAATALGTYGLIKLLSKSVGQDLPKYVKEFGSNVKPLVTDLAKDKKLGMFDKVKLNKFSKDFMAKYKEAAEAATGGTGEEAAGEAKEAFDNYSTKTVRELDKLSKEAYDRASATIDKRTLSLLRGLTLTLTTAFAGYVAKQPDTRFNTLDANAEKESKAFGTILKQNSKYLDEAFKTTFEEGNKGIVAPNKKPFGAVYASTLLDADEEKETQLKALKSKATGLAQKRNELLEQQQQSLSELDAAKIIKDSMMELEKYVMSIREGFVEQTVSNRLAAPLSVSGKLKGYRGEAALPVSNKEMTTQQKLYAEGGDAQEAFKRFDDLGKQRVVMEGAAQAISKEILKLTNVINTPGQDKEVVKAAKGQRNDLIAQYNSVISNTDELTTHMEALGTTLKNMVAYKDAIYQLNTALDELQIQNTVSGFKGMKEYLKDINMMVGGSRPDAAMEITLEQERMGLRTGVSLDNRSSNKYDLERAQILDSIFKGQGNIDSFYKLATLDDQKARDIENEEARRDDETFKSELVPFQELMTNLERVRTTENIDAGYGFFDKLNPFSSAPSEEIANTMGAVEKLLATATDEVSVASVLADLKSALRSGDITKAEFKTEASKYEGMDPDEMVRKGISLMDKKELTETSGKYNEAVKEAFKVAPTLDMQQMGVAVTDPITQRLDTSNRLLSEMLKETAGFSNKDIEKVFSGDYNKSFLSKIMGKADGGRIYGEGGPRADKVPAYLSPGEFVIRQKAATDIGYANLEKMNQGGTIPSFADGGNIPRFGSGGLNTSHIKQAQAYFNEEDASLPDIFNKKAKGYDKAVSNQYINLYKSLLPDEVKEYTSASSLKGLYNDLVDYDDEAAFLTTDKLNEAFQEMKKKDTGGFSLLGGLKAITGKDDRGKALEKITNTFADGGEIEDFEEKDSLKLFRGYGDLIAKKMKEKYREWVESRQPEDAEDQHSIYKARDVFRNKEDQLKEITDTFADGGMAKKDLSWREKIANFGAGNAIQKFVDDNTGKVGGMGKELPMNSQVEKESLKDWFMRRIIGKDTAGKALQKGIDRAWLDKAEKNKYDEGGPVLPGLPSNWLEDFKKEAKEFEKESYSGKAAEQSDSYRSFTGDSSGVAEVSSADFDRSIKSSSPIMPGTAYDSPGKKINTGTVRSFTGDSSGVSEVSEEIYNKSIKSSMPVRPETSEKLVKEISTNSDLKNLMDKPAQLQNSLADHYGVAREEMVPVSEIIPTSVPLKKQVEERKVTDPAFAPKQLTSDDKYSIYEQLGYGTRIGLDAIQAVGSLFDPSGENIDNSIKYYKDKIKDSEFTKHIAKPAAQTMGSIFDPYGDGIADSMKYYGDKIAGTDFMKHIGFPAGQAIGATLKAPFDPQGVAFSDTADMLRKYGSKIANTDFMKHTGIPAAQAIGSTLGAPFDPQGRVFDETADYMKSIPGKISDRLGVKSKARKTSILAKDLWNWFGKIKDNVKDPEYRARFYKEQLIDPTKNELNRLQDFALGNEPMRRYGKGLTIDYLSNYESKAIPADKPLGKLLGLLDLTPSGQIGKLEGMASFLSGGYASIASGWSALGGLPFGGLAGAQKNQKQIADMYTYQPKTKKGHKALDTFMTPFNMLGSLSGDLGDHVLDVTESPTAAALAASGLQASPMALPFVRGPLLNTTRNIRQVGAAITRRRLEGRAKKYEKYQQWEKHWQGDRRAKYKKWGTYGDKKLTRKQKIKLVKAELLQRKLELKKENTRQGVKSTPLKLAALSAEAVRQNAKNRKRQGMVPQFSEGGLNYVDPLVKPGDDRWGFTSYEGVTDTIMADEKAKLKREQADQLVKSLEGADERRRLQNDRVLAKGLMADSMRKYIEPSLELGDESPYRAPSRDGGHDIVVNGRTLGGKQALEYLGNVEHMKSVQTPDLGGSAKGRQYIANRRTERAQKAEFFANFDPTQEIPEEMLSDPDTRYASSLQDINTLMMLRKEELASVKGMKTRRKKEKELEKLAKDRDLAQQAVRMVGEGKNPATAIFDIDASPTVGERKSELEKDKKAGLITKKHYKEEMKKLRRYWSDDDRVFRLPKQKVSLGSIVTGAGAQARANLYETESKEFKKLYDFDRTKAFLTNPKLYQQMKDATDPKEKLKFAAKLAAQTKKSVAYTDMLGPDSKLAKAGKSELAEFLAKYKAKMNKKGKRFFGDGTGLDRKSLRGIATIVNKADGGRIYGDGGPVADKTPALVSPGEFVVREKSAKRLGYATLAYMNQSGNIPKFAPGGLIGDKPFGAASPSLPMAPEANKSLNNGTVTAVLENPEVTVAVEPVEVTLKESDKELTVKPLSEADRTMIAPELPPVEVTMTPLSEADRTMIAPEIAPIEVTMAPINESDRTLIIPDIPAVDVNMLPPSESDRTMIVNKEDLKLDVSVDPITVEPLSIEQRTMIVNTDDLQLDVKVDAGETTISSESIASLVSALEAALSSVTVETGGSVGAAKLDEFATALAQVNDRIPGVVKSEVEAQVLELNIEPPTDNAGLQDQVNNLTTLISSTSAKLDSININYTQKLDQIQSKADMALNFRNV